MRAFWKYDLFPFVLSDTVDEGRPAKDGRFVRVKGYGGATFRPIVILPDDKGDPIAEQLQALEDEFRDARVKLHNDFVAKVIEAAPFMAEVLK